MQKDLINRYGKYFENDNVVLDNYSLDAGIYVRVNKDGNILKILEVDKKAQEDLKGNEDYNWFKNRDFYSGMLDMNKSISTEVKEEKAYKTAKKFMSNNYLTIFFKSTIAKDVCEEEKEALPTEIIKKIIEQYYTSLQNLGKDDKKLLEKVNVPEIPIELMNECKNIYLNNIEKIFFTLKEKKVKKDTRIKLFIEDTVENYEASSFKYYALKIFNSNNYNQFLDEILYGANNYNFGMNSKKPYNELKTTTYKVPCRITLKEIKIIRNIYIWLIKNMDLFREEALPVDFNFCGDFRTEDLKEFFMLMCSNDNGNLVIDNFEYIPNYTNEIKEITFKNYINDLKLKDFEQKINKMKRLEGFINQNWFINCLQSGYSNKDTKYETVNSLRIDNIYKKFIIQYAKIFYEFFYKLNDRPIKQNIDKIGLDMTEKILINELNDTDFTKYKTFYNATKSLNIYLILKEYFNGNGGESVENKIDKLKENMRTVLNTEAHINTEEDFCFMLGQVSYYLISFSKAENLTQDVFDPILNAGNIEAVKKEIKFLYKKYKHEVGVNNKRFNKVFSELLVYEPKGRLKDNNTILLIGILTNNLFYEKKGEIVNE